MKTFIWSWRLICRWLVEAYFENTTGLAAMMAYDLIVLFVAPGFFLLSAFLSLFGTDPTLLHNIIALLEGFLPEMSHQIIEQQVIKLVVTGSTSWIALAGTFVALYLGINLINTISRTLNHCLGIKEPQRNWWNRWIIAVLLLFWLGVTILFSSVAILFGERLAAIIEQTYHLKIDLQQWVTLAKYPIIALGLIVFALVLYLLTPEVYQTVWQALPGAVFFSVTWLVATAIFGLYVKQRSSRYDETYATQAGTIVLLTWNWVTCLLLLLGGRLNAVLVLKWPTRPWVDHGHPLAGPETDAPAPGTPAPAVS